MTGALVAVASIVCAVLVALDDIRSERALDDRSRALAQLRSSIPSR